MPDFREGPPIDPQEILGEEESFSDDEQTSVEEKTEETPSRTEPENHQPEQHFFHEKRKPGIRLGANSPRNPAAKARFERVRRDKERRHAVTERDDEQTVVTRQVYDKLREYQSRISELEKQVKYDKLTGLLSKDGIKDMLDEAISTCKDANSPLTVGYVDLKGFKIVNDTIGHDAADQLLIAIAHYLQTITRESDLVSRIDDRVEGDTQDLKENDTSEELIFRAGGDEFVVAFVGTPLENIEGIFKDRLSDENFMGFVRSVMDEDQSFQVSLDAFNKKKQTNITLDNITVGARVGFAEMEEGDDAESMIKRADMNQNLLRDNQGRDSR